MFNHKLKEQKEIQIQLQAVVTINLQAYSTKIYIQKVEQTLEKEFNFRLERQMHFQAVLTIKLQAYNRTNLTFRRSDQTLSTRDYVVMVVGVIII